MKFCKDCKWFKHDRFGGSKFSKMYMCRHPKISLPKRNVVTGRVERLQIPAEDARRVTGLCGRNGKYFELKLGVLGFLKLLVSAIFNMDPTGTGPK